MDDEKNTTGGIDPLSLEPTTVTPTIEPESVKEIRTDDNEEVTVTRGKLRGMFKELTSEFDDKLKTRDDQIDILTRASDKSRMAKEMAKGEGPITRTIRVSTINNLMVVGWKNLVDIAPYKVGNAWNEGKQHYEITTEDGNKIEYPSHASFFDALNNNQVVCDVLSRKEKSDGNVMVEIKRQDTGKTYEIGVQFVN